MTLTDWVLISQFIKFEAINRFINIEAQAFRSNQLFLNHEKKIRAAIRIRSITHITH
jgi:hypothetical protein